MSLFFPRDIKESLISLGKKTISKKKPFFPQGGKRFLFKKYFSQKKNQLHGRGKNPIRYLRKYRGLLFFSHAALEDKYEMLPTYCPRDELKFIPRAEFAISYLSSMRLGKKTKKPCYFPGAKYTFSHGRSKIGLFLVIHGNNYTLFI